MTTQSFAALVAAQDYSSAVKVLDASIEETRQDYATALHRLVQLHLNRGLCNQRLHLNRKALKVTGLGLPMCAACSVDRRPAKLLAVAVALGVRPAAITAENVY
jgi:hypothetical protein